MGEAGALEWVYRGHGTHIVVHAWAWPNGDHETHVDILFLGGLRRCSKEVHRTDWRIVRTSQRVERKGERTERTWRHQRGRPRSKKDGRYADSPLHGPSGSPESSGR